MDETEIYKKFHAVEPSTFLLIMNYGECFTALYLERAIILRLIYEGKLDKDRLSDSADDYGYPRIEFGFHYLDEVVKTLLENNYSVVCIDGR